MKMCPECNKPNDNANIYCENCGFPFEESDSPISEEKVNNQEDVICDNGREKENEQEKMKDASIAGEKINRENAKENDEFTSEVEESDKIVEREETSESTQESIDKKEQDENQQSSKRKKKYFSKRTIGEIIGSAVLIIVLCITFNQNVKLDSLQSQYNKVRKELESANEEIIALTDENLDLTDTNEELKNGAAKQLVDIKNAFEKGEWEEVVNLASALHEKYNGSDEDKEAQKLASESQAKIDEANAAKAAEEAKGYETGITYDQLARTPDDYIGKKVKFSGKVVQVIEGDNIQIRLAVNDNYDTILFGQYESNIVSSRVLEDDHITIYGTSAGTISYESTMGGTITIPGVFIEKIDQ